ncbi:hypothetical protein [Chelatococcus asaccharovorans]|uniref:hypothetical protein n=1 Tax=Chelatococcus asaccharovorans TaxID=28210 RepID=UPI00224C6459|nr:hypothetical protein [Chelatococcus asaccharovorans]CAH1659967.1 conserved hypothetical protein [Chelatococcus asaccharovorans]CAH1683987.1 conserved hypothetical protein [Chelatococcus asaccharovorans]
MAIAIITAVLLIPGLLVLATFWAIARSGEVPAAVTACSSVSGHRRGPVEVRLPQL